MRVQTFVAWFAFTFAAVSSLLIVKVLALQNYMCVCVSVCVCRYLYTGSCPFSINFNFKMTFISYLGACSWAVKLLRTAKKNSNKWNYACRVLKKFVFVVTLEMWNYLKLREMFQLLFGTDEFSFWDYLLTTRTTLYSTVDILPPKTGLLVVSLWRYLLTWCCHKSTILYWWPTHRSILWYDSVTRSLPPKGLSKKVTPQFCILEV